MSGTLALALAAGMAATVNPCGFALLPAYLSAFVGTDEQRSHSGVIGRALAVSATMTAGFVTVFGLFGLLAVPLALQLERSLPWMTIVVGIGLVGLGAWLLAGRDLLVRLPRLSRGGRDGTLLSMYLFGVSYATASLSCTIGPFLAVTTTTFRSESVVGGLAVFVAYGLGMGVVIAVVTVAVGLARAGVVGRIRAALPLVHRVAGGLLVVAGAYVAYYGWYELRVLAGATGDPVIDRALAVQAWLQRLVVPEDPGRFAVGAGAALGALALATRLGRRRPTPDPPVITTSPVTRPRDPARSAP